MTYTGRWSLIAEFNTPLSSTDAVFETRITSISDCVVCNYIDKCCVVSVKCFIFVMCYISPAAFLLLPVDLSDSKINN